MAYNNFVGTDDDLQFPPAVMAAIAKSPEIKALLPESLTQAAYDALPIKVPGKLYVIIPG